MIMYVFCCQPNKLGIKQDNRYHIEKRDKYFSVSHCAEYSEFDPNMGLQCVIHKPLSWVKMFYIYDSRMLVK